MTALHVSNLAVAKRAFLSAGGLMLFVGLLSLGCGHTHTVGDAESAGTQKKAEDDGKSENHAEKQAALGSGHRADAPIKSDSRSDAPPLATSPAGLLKPDAMAAIQKKLVARGQLSADQESGKLDEPTQRALRAFQRDNHLPATGMPDDLTVQKLGIPPGQAFRATKPNGSPNGSPN
jgi:hypothetical protein